MPVLTKVAGSAGEHRRPVEGERLRAEEGCARRVEHDHAHVVGVGPHGELGIVEEVRAQVKAVPVIGACGIRRGGDGDALVRRVPGAGELADEPAVGNLVVEHDRVTLTAGLARFAEPGPDRRDGHGPEHRGARRLVEDLVPLVDDLDILRQAHLAVRVGRRAVAHHAREWDAVEIQDRCGHVRRGGVLALDDFIGPVFVMERDLRVHVRFVLGT